MHEDKVRTTEPEAASREIIRCKNCELRRTSQCPVDIVSGIDNWYRTDDTLKGDKDNE